MCGDCRLFDSLVLTSAQSCAIASLHEATRRVGLPNTFDWVIASKAKQSTVYECSIRLIATLALLARNDNKI